MGYLEILLHLRVIYLQEWVGFFLNFIVVCDEDGIYIQNVCALGL
jgi:hypothetical protein